MKLKAFLKTETVEIEDQNGEVTVYTVRELSGAEREKYLDTVNARMKFEDGKPVGFTSYEGSYTKLVSMCMVDDDGKKVNPETVKNWPQSTVEELFRLAQRLSGLDLRAEEEAKND